MKRVAALAAACLLTAAGCRTAPPSMLDLLASGTPMPVDDPQIAALIAGLEAQADRRRSLVAAARVSLEAPDLRFDRPQRIALRRPSDLRVEILGLFSQVAAILVTDGERYQFWQASRASTVEEGDVTPQLLWNVARIDLEPGEAVDLLLGAPTPAAGVAPASAATLSDGTFAIVFHSAAGDEFFQLDGEGRPVRVLRHDAGGSLLFDARFGDYRELADASFAHEVEIDFPRFNAHAVFEFHSVELNRDLPESAFRLDLSR